ncbi:4'-phosphopantetheinyl transferase superfamily protein [Allomuricauda sp. CP2A]|jgi:phosphopantetheinyl transferase (holo-ACP synthase)|uniref:4'-phosphopantetheinyl transferase family protein n=1 Tax=Allomuricauda sp. CP2A TaxID=1848189 RepID=UPI00082CBB0E|nr:4'-phosphopantetheinyl transferase superfamily protein [Muricauda sp. CP2A]
MVGNDIVDLHEAHIASNWQRPRFLTKLFTELEQRYIRDAKTPFLMVWRLWSMKEASYKLFTQIYPNRFYNPKGFECTVENNSGTVKFNGFQCYVETKETSKYIISEARLNKQKLRSKIVKFKTTNQKEQSEELKTRLLNYVGSAYQLKKNELNIPTLSNGKEHFNLSLTHHGTYGAFAIVGLCPEYAH